MDTRRRTVAAPAVFDPLEPRLLLTSTPELIAAALDLPEGVAVTYTGDPLAAQTRTLHATGGLLGLPTRPDEDFLILSTGDASWVDTVANEGEGQGTDLGAEGALGDTATLAFTLDVPAADRPQKLRLDFLFLSEEVPSWLASIYNDTFTVTANGVQIVALDINDDLVVYDGTLLTTGTFFDGRTTKLTATYAVPDGLATVDVQLSIADVGDGVWDSAVLVDNVRFETSELVWLNFEGMDVGDHFDWGTTTVLPRFETGDVRSVEDRDTVIAAIVALVEDKYSSFDIAFVTDRPVAGDYTTAVIGGSADTTMHLEPILQTLKGLPANTTLGEYFGGELLGLADAIDHSNVDKNSLSVVLSGEFAYYGNNSIANVAECIAHEVGHTLGLRHVTWLTDIMYPFETNDRGYIGADTFTYTIVDEDGLESTATVYLTVGDLPTAMEDYVVIRQGSGPVTIDVLDNDSNPDPTETLTIQSVTVAGQGEVVIIDDGEAVTFEPAEDQTGEDTFTYTLTDEDGNEDTAMVFVTVGNPPIANDDEAEVEQDGAAIAVDVLANDAHVEALAETMRIIGVTQGDHGAVAIIEDGARLTYQPASGYAGEDTFTYTITDGDGITATATVTMTVGHDPDPPTANIDHAQIEQGGIPIVIDVLANDTYLPDVPETFTITEVTQGQYGEVIIVDGGAAVTYQPTSNQFQDETMSLSESWGDGVTEQNDYEYLAGALGLAGGGPELARDYSAITGELIKTFDISFPRTLYNVNLGVAGYGSHVHFDRLEKTEHVSLDVPGAGTYVFVYASTKAGGEINYVSGVPVPDPDEPPAEEGTPIVGAMTWEDALVPLFDEGGNIVTEIPLARLKSSGKFEEVKVWRKNEWLPRPLEVSESHYYSAAGVDWLGDNKGAFTDADGDAYKIKLRGEGTVAVIMDDPDADGNGAIAQIILEDTTADSKLSISVKTPSGVAGDGLVEVGEIIAPALGAVKAKRCDLVGKGVQVAGHLGKLEINDLLNGSDVIAGGDLSRSSKVAVHVVGDGSLLRLDSPVTRFAAVQVGDAEIEAPGIKKLSVKGSAAEGLPGDFAADVTLSGGEGLNKTLGSVKIAGDVTGSNWNIIAGDVGGVTVTGSVADSTFRSAGNVKKLTFGRLVSSNVYVGIHQVFTAEDGSDGELPNSIAHFDNMELKSLTVKGIEGLGEGLADSNIAARRIGRVTVSEASYFNGGTVFGLAADRISRFHVKWPKLVENKLDDPQTIDVQDMLIRVL